jgi:NAD+ diphosphatase
MDYPEASTLPFNTSPLGDGFISGHPGEVDPGEPGCWIIFQGDCLVLDASEENHSLVEGEFPPWAGAHLDPLFIGYRHGRPVRILEIGCDSTIPTCCIAEPLLLTFFHEKLSDDLLSLAGRAQQILAWERKSAVCPRCGGGTDRIPGTWGKKCRACAYEHFPSIHPCTLVLVCRGEEVLLIRKPEWPPGYYSLPSGFCDFGESLEECAHREVEEETGVKIGNLRYVGSQCWPFPGQLMIGFTADYAAGEIVVDRDELEDAAWFRRNALPPTFSMKSIAGWMMNRFA